MLPAIIRVTKKQFNYKNGAIFAGKAQTYRELALCELLVCFLRVDSSFRMRCYAFGFLV